MSDATAPARRPRGRPPATAEQRLEVRMRISRAAVGLFTAQGFEATRVEDVASAAGVSVRTLWRHFDTKAGCIKPVIAANIGLAARMLTGWDGQSPLRDHLLALPEMDLPEPLAPRVIALVQLTRDPALGQVWLEVHRETEDALAVAMAERTGLAADSLEVRNRAAMLNATLRVAGEWTAAAHPDATTDDELRRAIRAGFVDLGF